MDEQLSWCPGCRRWRVFTHFRGEYPLACGFGDLNLRDHSMSPRCGDIWQMQSGPAFVIDVVTTDMVAYTESFGSERFCLPSRGAFLQNLEFLNYPVLISAFEDRPLFKTGLPYPGWSGRHTSEERSVRFIRKFLKNPPHLQDRLDDSANDQKSQGGLGTIPGTPDHEGQED